MIVQSLRFFLIKNSLFAPFSKETLHPFNSRRGSAALPIPLELIYVLTKHVSCPEGGDKVIKLSLVLPLPATCVIIAVNHQL